MSSRFSRRNLLKTLGLGAAMLPILHHDTQASPTGFPKRLVIMWTPNGVIPAEWFPKGGETDFTFAAITAPLERIREHVVIFGNVALQSAIDDAKRVGHGHFSMPHCLTGGNGWYEPNSKGELRLRAAGQATVDQFIADEIAKKTPLPRHSLTLGVKVRSSSSTLEARISYKGANQPVTPQGDPYALFDGLFGEMLAGDPTALDRIRADRRSVLDVVRRELSALSGKLDAQDRERLDAHLAGVQRLEKTLSPHGAVCTPPTLGPRIDLRPRETMPTVVRAHNQIVASALACDLTRVVTIQYLDTAGGGMLFPWLGKEYEAAGRPGYSQGGDLHNHHNLSHDWPNYPDQYPLKLGAERWIVEQYVELVELLASTKEGSGSVLDNTAVVLMNGMSNGSSHNNVPLPLVLAGSCGGYFETGRFLNFPTRLPHNRLLTSLCNAMDVPVSHFGDAKYGSGEVPGLRA